MTTPNEAIPTYSPNLTALASLLLPGLGQLLSGQRGRGLAFLLSVALALVLVWWQGLTGLYLLVAFIWLWSAWDAYNLAQGRVLSFTPPLLAVLAITYTVGWRITEINPAALLRQANRAAPIVSGLLSPDFLEQESEARRWRTPSSRNWRSWTSIT